MKITHPRGGSHLESDGRTTDADLNDWWATAEGIFWDWPGDTEVMMAREPG